SSQERQQKKPWGMQKRAEKIVIRPSKLFRKKPARGAEKHPRHTGQAGKQRILRCGKAAIAKARHESHVSRGRHGSTKRFKNNRGSHPKQILGDYGKR